MKILLINTGGTIACEKTDAGYSPASPVSLLEKLSPFIGNDIDITLSVPFFIDSSDVKPTNWQTLAKEIYDGYNDYDGFLITHGTDTMQYTAAALSLMLKNLAKPVVLTGSQLPLIAENTDGYSNFRDALDLAASGKPGVKGVLIAFGGRIISAPSAYKFHSTDFDAFRGAAPDFGTVADAAPLTLLDKLCEDVILVKLTPNTKPELICLLKDMGYKGVVIEGFGLGGIPSGLLPCIGRLIRDGIRVVYVSSCNEGGANLDVYSIGSKAKEIGVEDGKALTPGYAVVKLMHELAYKNRTP